MAYLVSQISKYLMTLIICTYAFECFSVFRYKSEQDRDGIYKRQNILMYLMHFLGFFTLYVQSKEIRYIIAYLLQEAVIVLVIFAYKKLYPHANRLIVNNMCMLLSIGLIILSRLSWDKAMRQFAIMTGALIVSSFIPYLFGKIKNPEKYFWLYSGIGAAALMIVLLFSSVVNGSRINITIANYTFQPSELVKIIFVFAIAGILNQSTDLKHVIISAAIAAVHVLLLVASKDLGSAVIYFVVYFTMLYVATRNLQYYLFGLVAGGLAAVIGYKLFSHVRVRIIAYTDPFGTIETSGYQIAQSLFAIGTGGWFGMGLGQGAPNSIPVVAADFIFAAIVEELGVFFGICLILICISCFVMFMNISMRLSETFNKLVALGLSVAYGFQVFLTIGGVIKFIPLTGVTLPLVSYGGTSVVVTLILFAIIQSMYILPKSESAKSSKPVKSSKPSKPSESSKPSEPEDYYFDETEKLPDEEDLAFERAVEEGLKIASDDFENYELGRIDDI